MDSDIADIATNEDLHFIRRMDINASILLTDQSIQVSGISSVSPVNSACPCSGSSALMTKMLMANHIIPL